jgi:hypothetical protein
VSAWAKLRRIWLAALRAGPVILLVALLPSVSYIDHWSEFVTSAVAHEAAEAEGAGDDSGPEPRHAEDDSHAAHCHTNIASCAEQPAPADLRLLHVVVDFSEPALTETPLEYSDWTLAGFVVPIPTEPPRLFS